MNGPDRAAMRNSINKHTRSTFDRASGDLLRKRSKIYLQRGLLNDQTLIIDAVLDLLKSAEHHRRTSSVESRASVNRCSAK